MADQVEVKLLFFARGRELAGCKHASISVPAKLTAAQLFDLIVEKYPSLASLRGRSVLSVRAEYTDPSDQLELKSGDEVAVIPPISGGAAMTRFAEVTDDPLSVDKYVKLVTSPKAGAISTFIGTTRDTFEGKTVVRLEYEAYTEMAEKEMLKICDTILERWECTAVAMGHRTGVVPVCEASVIIAVSSPHRRASLEAVQYAIDTLKSTVPIWKKEVYAEGCGPAQWKENCEGCKGHAH